MNISSLLCTDDPPKPPLRPSPSPPISPKSLPKLPTPDPVILAPHLRGHHALYPTQQHHQQQQQQRVLPLDHSSQRDLRDRDPDLLQIRKRSFSPDTSTRDPSPFRRPPYANMDEQEPHRSTHPGLSSANFAYGPSQQQQQPRHLQMEPSPFTPSAQRHTYSQQRPPSDMGYHSRPSSSHSHSHSPTIPHFQSAQPTIASGAPPPPTSLSRITTSHPHPFAREGPSPSPVVTTSQRGSPLMSYYPPSRAQAPPQPSLRRLSPHSHSPILNTATPYTYPPVPSQPPSASANSMPTTPYTPHPHHPHPHPHPSLHPQLHHQYAITPTITTPKQVSSYGLDALVQAASQEHMRINSSANANSGVGAGTRTEGESNAGKSRHRSSLDEKRVSSSSPIMDRGSGGGGYSAPVSPHRSSHHHQSHSHSHSNEAAPYSASEHECDDSEYEYEYGPQQRKRGTLVPVPVVDVADPRPIKRQRMSDPLSGPASAARLTSAEERERNFAAHYGVAHGQKKGHGHGHTQRRSADLQGLPTRLSGPGAHEYTVNNKAMLGIGAGTGSGGGSGEGSRAVLDDATTATATAAPPRRRASSGSVGGPGKAWLEKVAEVKVQDQEVSLEKLKTTTSTPTSTSPRPHTPLPPPPPLDTKPSHRQKPVPAHKDKDKDKEQVQTKEQVTKPKEVKVKEQDAHEWLLEHYAGTGTNTPSASSATSYTTPTSSSMAITESKNRAAAARIAPRNAIQQSGGATHPGSRGSIERAESKTPGLERELGLEDVLGSGGASGGNSNNGSRRHREADSTDPDVVLEMVVESLDAEDNDDDADAAAAMSSRVSMEVDEELLSLVDDPVPAAPLQQAPQAPARQYAALPPSLRVTKHLTPTVVTVLSPPSFASPGPASPFPSNVAPERGSMPPPATTGKGSAEKKAESSSATATAKGKKGAAQKPAPKPKQPAKPRAKAKPKAKVAVDGTNTVPASAAATKGSKLLSTPVPPAIKKPSAAVGASRSRSTSAMPGGNALVPEGDSTKMVTLVEPAKDPEVQEDGDEDKEDGKLYCVCKTQYDEDRVMIACDRCDEWYHTQCVNMPDLEIDLVDQFFCPPCIESNPELHLQTTYKKRCYRGLHHSNPSSPDACHKAARGDFSKYCSDECGIEFMKARITAWAKNGGNKERLWERVRNAERREGVVVCADVDMLIAEGADGDTKPVPPKNMRVERDVERLNGQLDQVMHQRERLKKEMDVVVWRARLVELATERSEKVDECAWDQRLCFGDEEYAEFGLEVLASYEDNAVKEEVKAEGEDAMQVDNVAADDGEWWCRGKKKCERHSGWQKLRAAEVSFEKEVKEAGLLKLTTQEREIRKRIEDLLDPQARNPPSSSPLKSGGRKPPANGHTKRPNGDIVKKGKKKRA